MESFFSRFRNPLFLIAILLAQTIALAIQVQRPLDPGKPDGQEVRLLRLWAIALISPLERLSTGTSHGLRVTWANYLDLRGVRQQNKNLQKQLEMLRMERAALSEDALQGQRLRSLLTLRQGYLSTTLIAQVIGTSGSDQSRLLTLDKGWHDGLKSDMAVITPDGIVGMLRDVFPSTSQLLLINDQTSGAGVILQSTRTRAILRGSLQGRIQISNLMPDARIKVGDVVLTSGGDQVFPRGLPVGTVESIVADPDHQPYTILTLRSAANLNQLEEVLVITEVGSDRGVAAQKNPAAEAGATPQARGAESNAARLPGLSADPAHPGDSLPDEPPPGENSTGLVPKPKPALHPDRFSPGAAAPATALKPGAPKNNAQQEMDGAQQDKNSAQ